LGLISSILGGIAQGSAAAQLTPFSNALSDTTSFFDTYINVTASPLDTSPCFCTVNATADAVCSTAKCVEQGTSCDSLFLQTKNCEASYFQYTCNCAYHPGITTCNGTTISYTKTPQPGIDTAFSACRNHYHAITAIIWTLFAFFVVSAILDVVFTLVLDLWKNIKTPVPKYINIVTFVVTAALTIALIVLVTQGKVCTTPPAPSTSSTTSSPSTTSSSSSADDLRLSTIPACHLKVGFSTLEQTLYEQTVLATGIIGIDPVINILEFLHRIFNVPSALG